MLISGIFCDETALAGIESSKSPLSLRLFGFLTYPTAVIGLTVVEAETTNSIRPALSLVNCGK
jgi:hypothetical protein